MMTSGNNLTDRRLQWWDQHHRDGSSILNEIVGALTARSADDLSDEELGLYLLKAYRNRILTWGHAQPPTT